MVVPLTNRGQLTIFTNSMGSVQTTGTTTLALGSPTSSTGVTTSDWVAATSAAPVDRQEQEHFLHLLQEAERRHRETLQRALHAEKQVHQLRQVFQQWQSQLQQQLQAHRQAQLQQQRQMQMQQHVQNQMQLQVQRQMQALHDALLRQQTTYQSQQLQVRQQLEEMYTFQQLHAFSNQQQLGELQLELFSLERNQQTERRNRQILQRRVRQPTKSFRPGGKTKSPAVGATPCCPDDDCCPCEFPEQCPYNPCVPENNCSQLEIPEGPEGGDCFLRDIRLGLINSSSCTECKSQGKSPRQRRKDKRNFPESESGYMADDESSCSSDISSKSSSAFQEERRQLLQEVRNLHNAHLVPRYKQIWKPLRCFRCGGPGHLAKFCSTEPTTVL